MKTLRILHVDNAPEWLKGVCQVLQTQKVQGVVPSVVWAMSCEEALQELKGRDKPDVIIQDLFMGHGDSDRLFRGERLKAFEVIGRAAVHHVPCVILSNVGRLGKDQSAKEFQAGLMSRTGASAYVTKDEYDETEGKALVGTLERLLTADKQ